MKPRYFQRYHRLIGLILLLPLLTWTFTGFVFYFKPGYGNAYHQLAIQSYPITHALSIEPSVFKVYTNNEPWLDTRIVHSILGIHLLVRTNDSQYHFNYNTQKPWHADKNLEIRKLIQDACDTKSKRYGKIIQLDELTATTDTQVEITLDWSTLKLRQKGRDSRIINKIYDFHYLRLTPYAFLNKIIVLIALVGLIVLSGLGLALSGFPNSTIGINRHETE